MQVSEIQLFQILKEKLGEKEAQTLVEYVETKVERGFEVKKDVLATKEDISRLEILIERSSKENIKWMIIFFIPLYLTLLGFILTNIDKIIK